MALLTICNRNQTLTDEREIRDYLSTLGIDYERWPTADRVPAGAPQEKILEAYAGEIEKLKDAGGYVTADVIDVSPETAGLDEMLAKFDKEHWHDEDEVRFVISGGGLFHIHGRDHEVVADLRRNPRAKPLSGRARGKDPKNQRFKSRSGSHRGQYPSRTNTSTLRLRKARIGHSSRTVNPTEFRSFDG